MVRFPVDRIMASASAQWFVAGAAESSKSSALREGQAESQMAAALSVR